MALVSPGVQVTVIDESFYTPAEPGTTPLIVVATAQDKTNAAGTGTAAATTKANAGVAYRLTSQKDLVDLFGVPYFEKTASGSPIHGSELNEFGLLAAYSLLGVTNSVFMVRADVNLAELEGQATQPGAEPNDNQWWVDTASSSWGIQEWNSAPVTTTGGQKFSAKTPSVLTDADSLNIELNIPAASYGNVGDYAVVFETGSDLAEAAKFYYKSAGNGDSVEAGTWVLVGSKDWKASHPAAKGTITVDSAFDTGFNGSFLINNTLISGPSFGDLQSLVNAINGLSGPPGVSAQSVNGKLYLYTDGTSASDGSTTEVNAAIFLENVPGSETTWEDLGLVAGVTYNGPQFQQSPHTDVPQWKSTGAINAPTGSVWIKTTVPNGGAEWSVKKWVSATQTWNVYPAPLYESTHAALYYLDRAAGGANLAVENVFVQFNSTEAAGLDTTPSTANFRVWSRRNVAATVVTSDVLGVTTSDSSLPLSSYSFSIKQSVPGTAELVSAEALVSFVGDVDPAETAKNIVAAITSATFGFDSSGNTIPSYVRAERTSDNRVKISHSSGGDIRLTEGTNNPLSDLFASGGYNPYTNVDGIENLYALGDDNVTPGATEDYLISNWGPLSIDEFQATPTAPSNEPYDGQLWYNPSFGDVDLMVHNGTRWVGFNNHPDYSQAQIIVGASEPALTTAQKNIDKHIWVSTADLENFPTMYRWSKDNKEWNLIDKADQTSEEGVLFADARYGTTGASGNTAKVIDFYRDCDYLDPDAPNPDLYPSGMLLWNLRRSGGNVKRYANSYIDVNARNVRYYESEEERLRGGQEMTDYATDRWVTTSANNEDGSGSFGRKAQRKVVVAAMKSVTDTSQQIRDEERRNFNIIAAPGYPELLSNLINLNIDRGLTAFVIGDTPLRLSSDATTLVNWGTNAALVVDNGDDGIVSYDEYCAVYYPNGYTTDLSGIGAVVPASHMMLRTIALSDQVSYPWFAPAGTRRGGITNATSVGYIDAATGEFQTVALNEGTRDVLYDLKVNPIPFFVGSGLVAWGQKTRARNASALDRINVARLIVYLRSQLNKLARPYIFEPNDKITRDEIKGAVESLLLELVGLRAIYDFAVVCDETNNTPSRIDRNELYVDIAIEPVKAVEFIYIPLRVKNTGEI